MTMRYLAIFCLCLALAACGDEASSSDPLVPDKFTAPPLDQLTGTWVLKNFILAHPDWEIIATARDVETFAGRWWIYPDGQFEQWISVDDHAGGVTGTVAMLDGATLHLVPQAGASCGGWDLEYVLQDGRLTTTLAPVDALACFGVEIYEVDAWEHMSREVVK